MHPEPLAGHPDCRRFCEPIDRVPGANPGAGAKAMNAGDLGLYVMLGVLYGIFLLWKA